MTQQQPAETFAKSYRYVRISMIALLAGLGTSVIYQAGQQDWHLLASVSAYYYTPAQGIFVGALTALAACMIALRGTTDAEDVLLNLGGMFAVVVAVVPTTRDKDYQTTVRLCAMSTDNLPAGVDCPRVQELAAATRANVENNMTALLVIGLVSLLVLIGLVLRHRRSAYLVPTAWAGIVAATVIYLAGAFAFLTNIDWFIDNAHFVAAVCLSVCIVAVAVVNALRLRQKQQAQPSGSTTARNWYGLVALLMIGVCVVGAVLFFTHVLTLFWLEIAIAGMFAVFWTVQTIEQMPITPGPTTPAAVLSAPEVAGRSG